MPFFFNNSNKVVAVTMDELVPKYYQTSALKLAIHRGIITKLQRACNGRKMLVDFDSLPKPVRNELTDPRRFASELQRWYKDDERARTFYRDEYKVNGDRYLNPKLRDEYTLNASVLQAVNRWKEAHIQELTRKGKKPKRLYAMMANEVGVFKKILLAEDGLRCTLPESEKRFAQLYDEFFKSAGVDYTALITEKIGNSNAGKAKDTQQKALLRKLLGYGNNFDYEQVRMMYNEIASRNGWKPISRGKVELFAKENKLVTEAGRRGNNHFNNTIAMQHKRRPTGLPMRWWTIDGWDVELFYQETGINKKGHSDTNYYKNPTVVIIIDNYTKYPIGYAVGTHETVELIRQAVRNAYMHVAELFGAMYMSMSLQSDRYSNGNLDPFFRSACVEYMPAKPHNAKTKPIEPYFKELNRNYCQLLNNWSGFGITGNKDNQPNAEWKTAIRHSNPDFKGVCTQIDMIMQTERSKKHDDFVAGWTKVPDEYRDVMTVEQFLYRLGETKERTTKLRGEGLSFRISNTEFSYDSFDIEFRRHIHQDWCVQYNPADMECVLATTKDGTKRFLLERKYEEGSNWVDRNEMDENNYYRIENFNDAMKEQITTENEADSEETRRLFQDERNYGTLSKLVLADDAGQHKNRKNAARIKKAQTLKYEDVASPNPSEGGENESEKKALTMAERQQKYYDDKINLKDYGIE